MTLATKSIQGQRFLRNTHDASGQPRRLSAGQELALQTARCSIHMLDPRRPMSFDEVVAAHERYDRDYWAEGFGYRPREIEEGLMLLIEAGLARFAGPEPAYLNIPPQETDTKGRLTPA